MLMRLLVTCMVCAVFSVPLRAEHASVSVAPDCVVLLHGLWRDARAMSYVEQQLQQNGYSTVNISYPSTQQPLPLLADTYVDAAVQGCRNQFAPRIHFVTHSMGGILARWYLQGHEIPEAGRVVMLSPPNHGSEWVDWLRDNFLMKPLLGPAGLQLSTDSELLRGLKPLRLEIGVITGSGGRGWFGMPEPNDNAVTVASAQLEEMQDFLVVPHNHVSIRRSEHVLRQTLAFLRDGRFAPAPPAPSSLPAPVQEEIVGAILPQVAGLP